MSFSLRAKIISITIVVLFFAMSALTLISTRIFAREYSKVLQTKSFIIGQNLKFQLDRLLKLGISLEDLIGFEEQCSSVVEEYKDISSAMVVNLNGKILFHSDSTQHGKKITDQITLKTIKDPQESTHISLINEQKYQVVIIPVLSPYGEHIAAVGISFPVEVITQKTKGLIASHVLITFIFFAFSITLITFVFSLWVTKPLKKLIGVIQEIREKGVLNKRVEINSKDEIGQLASNFNNMTGELQRTTTSIYTLNKEIAERKRAEQNLKEVVEKAELVYKVVPSAIFTVDKEQRITSWNDKAVEVTGYTAEEIIGEKCDLFAKSPCGEKCGLYSDGVAKPVIAKECTVQRKDGQQRVISKNADLLRDANNYIIGGIESFEDITERKKAEQRMQAAYSELRKTQDLLIQAEKLNAVGQLASGVAHEVKNPLAIIIQGVNYLENKLSPKQKDTFKVFTMVKDSVSRADNIVQSLLDFSKITILDLKPQDINAILEDSLRLVKQELKFEHIEIVKKTKRNIPQVLVDKNRIEQVFVNVFLNATQAMPKRGKIIIRSYYKRLEELKNGIGRRKEDYFRPGEKAVIVEIEDTGAGLTEENLKKAFDPFFTTKGLRGAGLGLSVSRSIISMHKGLIDVKSQKGKGTKVIVALKIAESR